MVHRKLHTQVYIFFVSLGGDVQRSQTQKSPSGLRYAGFQDFILGSGDHQQRVLVGWWNV